MYKAFALFLGISCLWADEATPPPGTPPTTPLKKQPLEEKEQAQKVEEKPYDYDLFRKDVNVYFINTELLYWAVDEGALDYAIKMKKPAWGNPTDAVGHYKVASFGWDPGVRVAFGWLYAPHYWDIYGQYTYFRGTGHDEAHAPHSSHDRFLNGTWPQPNPSKKGVPLKHAESDIALKIHMLEWLFSRRFHPNPHLRIRLNGGVDVAWLRQNWEIEYKDVRNNKSHLHNLWHFNGAGIRIGVIVDWFLAKFGLYFTGLASGAFLAGDYHNVSKQTSNFSGRGFHPSRPLRNAHYHDTRLVPHFQVAAGPSWQKAFESIRVEVFLGYELNIWSNLHEVIRTSSGTPRSPKLTTLDIGSVGIQGATLRFSIDF